MQQQRNLFILLAWTIETDSGGRWGACLTLVRFVAHSVLRCCRSSGIRFTRCCEAEVSFLVALSRHGILAASGRKNVLAVIRLPGCNVF